MRTKVGFLETCTVDFTFFKMLQIYIQNYISSIIICLRLSYHTCAARSISNTLNFLCSLSHDVLCNSFSKTVASFW